MKVILLQDVKKQGKKDDIIDVSDGYANNFLIKNNLAVAYTKTSKDILEKQFIKRDNDEQALIKKCEIIKKQLISKNIVFEVKTGDKDKMFGTISSKQIEDKIKELGVLINKKSINLKNPIDSLGIHEVEIILHKKVIFNIKINVQKR